MKQKKKRRITKIQLMICTISQAIWNIDRNEKFIEFDWDAIQSQLVNTIGLRFQQDFIPV